MSWGDPETAEERAGREAHERKCADSASEFVDAMGYMDNAIFVWRFDEAPASLQVLSQHGGDEDWLALVPPGDQFRYVPWLESESFGCCDISEHRLPNGWRVHIGAHA